MPRLTAKFIEENGCCPAQGQRFIRDDELKGFGLRLTKGSMSWIVEARINGRMKRLTIGKYTLMSVDEAREAARKILHDAAAQPYSINVPTLGQVLDAFLSVRSLSKNAAKSYKSLLCRCLPDWLHLPMTSITREMVLTRHKDITRPTRYGTPGRSQANHVMSTLNRMFRFAMHHYEADGNPVVLFNPVMTLSQNRAWHQLGPRRVIIPDHKLKDFYRALLALRQKMARDYFLILLLTGLRRMEAATLKWQDVDFISKTITVRSHNTKNRNEFDLPMSAFVFDIMERRRQDPRRSEFVFPGRKDHLVDNGHCFEQVVGKLDLEVVPHDLRRTFVTAAAKLGVPHHIIRRLVNHRCIRDITDGYVVLHVEHLREPMEKISQHFLQLFEFDKEEWDKCVDFYRPGFLQPGYRSRNSKS